ncbi:Hypothetical predicted protein [Podarcis lilfordi]|uniref:Uncharacterized protein n=1 Tax=Podarcis lilfordi TaxID=74358 RepID=A0AA35PPP2_9SAUR|nr:Hypothetical predicted protein [Podarcis lilfordi]
MPRGCTSSQEFGRSRSVPAALRERKAWLENACIILAFDFQEKNPDIGLWELSMTAIDNKEGTFFYPFLQKGGRHWLLNALHPSIPSGTVKNDGTLYWKEGVWALTSKARHRTVNWVQWRSYFSCASWRRRRKT